MSLPQVLPDDVSLELTRAVRRWRQLPLDRAVASAPGVHVLLAELAGRAMPDLGPGVLMDQLAVAVHDWCGSGHDEGSGAGLADRLRSLRLSWSDPT